MTISCGLATLPAQQQESGLTRGKSDRQFVIQPTIDVTQHLVLIDDQQRRAVPVHQPMLLGLQRCYQDRGAQVFGQVSSRDTHIPSTGAPFGQLVICQGTGRDGVNSLAPIFALV